MTKPINDNETRNMPNLDCDFEGMYSDIVRVVPSSGTITASKGRD